MATCMANSLGSSSVAGKSKREDEQCTDVKIDAFLKWRWCTVTATTSIEIRQVMNVRHVGPRGECVYKPKFGGQNRQRENVHIS